MEKFDDVYESWCYIQDKLNEVVKDLHDKHNAILSDEINSYLYIECVKVNPETGSIDDDISKNTKNNVWFEFGFPEWNEEDDYLIEHVHDIDLDCGADTFEEAVIMLANNIYENYGNAKGVEEVPT